DRQRGVEAVALGDRRDAAATDAPADRAGDAIAGLAPLAGNIAVAFDNVAGQFELVVVAGAADLQIQAVVAAAVGVAGPAAQPFMDVVEQVNLASAGPG